MPAGGSDSEAFALELQMLRNAQRLQRDDRLTDVGEVIEGAARDFMERAPNERAGVLSTTRRHTKFLDYRAMRRVCGHDFDLSELKTAKAGMTVYLCLPANRLKKCNRWLRLFINLLLDAMERERTKPAHPVLACLDEFPVLGHMSQLEDAAGQIASFGVKLWVILQDWGQGVALYKDRWETFVGNAGVLQFFGTMTCGQPSTFQSGSARPSSKSSAAGQTAPDQKATGVSGRSDSLEQFDLLTPDEVGRQFARSDRLKRQLIFWAGYHPLMIQRAEYFDKQSPVHRHFAGKYWVTLALLRFGPGRPCGGGRPLRSQPCCRIAGHRDSGSRRDCWQQSWRGAQHSAPAHP